MPDLETPRLNLKPFANIGAVVTAILFLTNWPIYHYTVLGGPNTLVYYFVPILIVMPLLIVRTRALAQLWREPVVVWFAIYALSGILWTILIGDVFDEAHRQWRLRVLAFALFCSALIFVGEGTQRYIARAILFCLIAASINNWIDFLYPFTFVAQDFEHANPGRGAGFFINANQAASAVIAMTIALLPFVSARSRPALMLILLFGTYPTFSRSGFVLALILTFSVVMFGQLRRTDLLLLVVLLPIAAAVAWQLHATALSSDGVNVSNIQERIDFFTSGGVADDFSARVRLTQAYVGWQMFTENPLLGNGLDSSGGGVGGQGTHNMYLMLLAEQGMVGGALYIALLLMITIKGLRLRKRGRSTREKDLGVAMLLFGGFFALMGLFSHNLLDEPRTLFLLAFLLAAEWSTSLTPRSQSPTRPYVAAA